LGFFNLLPVVVDRDAVIRLNGKKTVRSFTPSEISILRGTCREDGSDITKLSFRRHAADIFVSLP